MDFLFDPEWVQRIIDYLFPDRPTPCTAPGGYACIPAGWLGL